MGDVFAMDSREVRGERTILTYQITDGTYSVLVKIFDSTEKIEKLPFHEIKKAVACLAGFFRGTKKWERIESYGPKFVENIVQAISRDILAHSMRTLSHCFICGHVHDELIIECSMGVSLDPICEQMGRTPAWIPGLLLRADGYECSFYKKD